MNEFDSDIVRSGLLPPGGTMPPSAATQKYTVTVEQRLGGRRFVISVEPNPVMRWHDVTNVREEIRAVVRSTAGLVDRRNAILARVQTLLREWSTKGLLFPSNYCDGDEFIYALGPTERIE